MVKISNLIIKIDDFELLTTEEIILKKNEKMLLIGNNSSGKSLFLKSLHKKYFNHNGNFEISQSGIFNKKRKHSLYIEPEVNLFADKSIFKNITFPLDKIKDRTLEKISDLCNIAKLGEIYSTKCSVLSYSQMKMVELIRAVIVNPIVILIDDIDNYFDDINMNLLFEIFKASDNDFSVIATAKKLKPEFTNLFRIQNKKVVRL